MEQKKQKQNRKYTLMVISDSAEGGIRQFFLEQSLIRAVLVTVFCLIAIAAGYIAYSAYRTDRLAQANAALTLQMGELSAEKESLAVENMELSENVTLLSDTINQKVQKEEEEAEKSIPNGFPLAGAASIQESSEVDAVQEEHGENAEEAEADAAQEGEEAEAVAEQNPIVVFSASPGTSVIVTGNGVVQAVEADETYGNVIRVDHGNGYVSVYRNPSPAKVKVGDEITKGTMLIEMTTENEKLGYQIMKDGEYIDPLELMEIYG